VPGRVTLWNVLGEKPVKWAFHKNEFCNLFRMRDLRAVDFLEFLGVRMGALLQTADFQALPDSGCVVCLGKIAS
jgi:hypothetical protein